MTRRCIVCGVPIAECMGAVVPRDAVLLMLGVATEQPRELCGRASCHARWLEWILIEEGPC